VLDNGKAGGRQVLPAAWLEACMSPRVSADENRRYGYQWYIGDIAFGSRVSPRLERWVGCFGNGGQRLWVLPELDLVIAITGGNYGMQDQWIPPVRILRELVLPGIR
jgi:CubicO group peptidase (beta-lactamase class C family)